MGFHLVNVKNQALCYGFAVHNWGHVLALAKDGGWRPQGTVLEGDPTWPGYYRSNDHQTVTAEDARELADALERVIDSLPNQRTMPESTIYTNLMLTPERRLAAIREENHMRGMFKEKPLAEDALVMTFSEWQADLKTVPHILFLRSDERYSPEPRDVWSGQESKQYLQGFVAFCRSGAFSIH